MGTFNVDQQATAVSQLLIRQFYVAVVLWSRMIGQLSLEHWNFVEEHCYCCCVLNCREQLTACASHHLSVSHCISMETIFRGLKLSVSIVLSSNKTGTLVWFFLQFEELKAFMTLHCSGVRFSSTLRIPQAASAGTSLNRPPHWVQCYVYWSLLKVCFLPSWTGV